MKKRSLTIDGHRTSISLEDEFWESLKEIANKSNQSLVEVVKEIDESRISGLSSAIRIFVLKYYKS
ncbi:MAG: ribbon-helix-helix domain-containing protein [Candidatus Paracaedibacteraceae bacterium]|nr:ribbon-helix-helix domain-containing protein [Candidatus Paracaedibacteraceae bacterium]